MRKTILKQLTVVVVVCLAASFSGSLTSAQGYVWGVGGDDQIYPRPANGSGKWIPIKGRLMHVSASKDWVWGVNANHNIFKCKQPCTGAWEPVSGYLKQIDASDSAVWGVNKNDQIYTRPVDGSGKWTLLPGKLMHVSAGNDWVWGVNASHNIYKCKQPCTGAWEPVDGYLKQIDVSDWGVWGVNKNDQIYTRPADGSGSWTLLSGLLRYVSASNDWVWGVNKHDNIYKCQQPCAGAWVPIEGRLKQLDVFANVDGQNAKQVSYAAGGMRSGAFYQTAPKTWMEMSSEGASFDFEELGRDEWSIYLRDRVRNVSIALDLHRKKVVDRDSESDLFDIMSWQSSFPGADESAADTAVDVQIVARPLPTAAELAVVTDEIVESIPDIPDSDKNAIMKWIKIKMAGNVQPFCWRQSTGRGIGRIPGRWADCPQPHYKNIGTMCIGVGDNLSAPSLLPDCPDGYTNNGPAGCGRGTHDIYAPSKLGGCPNGTNVGLFCADGLFSTSAIKCGPGYFKGPFERCYLDCERKYGKAYTNTGEFCHRPVSLLGPSSFKPCPAGYFKNSITQRCHKACPAGYNNTGETCHKTVGAPTSMDTMICRPDEYKVGARCFEDKKARFPNGPANDGCPAGFEDNAGLCYPNCKDGYDGKGPVCWQQCAPGWTDCGAGCAKSDAECGLAVTDQVLSSLTLAANAATFGLAAPVTGTVNAGSKSATIGGKVYAASSKAGRSLVELLQTAKPNVAKDASVYQKIIGSRFGIGVTDVPKSITKLGYTVNHVDKINTAARVAAHGGKAIATVSVTEYRRTMAYLAECAEEFDEVTSPEINDEINRRLDTFTGDYLKREWCRIRLHELAAAEGLKDLQTRLALASVVDISGITGAASAFIKPVCQDVVPFPSLSESYGDLADGNHRGPGAWPGTNQ